MLKSVPQPKSPLDQVSFPEVGSQADRFAPKRFVVEAVVAKKFVDVANVVVA